MESASGFYILVFVLGNEAPDAGRNNGVSERAADGVMISNQNAKRFAFLVIFPRWRLNTISNRDKAAIRIVKQIGLSVENNVNRMTSKRSFVDFHGSKI